MNPEDVASRLHENERRILLSLKDRGSATTEELSQLTGLSRDAIEKASAWAETKGVVSFREEVSRSFKLTDEGRGYAETGLPEKRLIELVSSGSNEISGLKDGFPELSIALVWVRRNGWANIKNGRLELTEEGRRANKVRSLDETIISSLNEGVELNLDDDAEERLTLLVKRGLVEVEEQVERWVGITDLGKEVAPYVEPPGDVKVITQLTPEILQTGAWRDTSFQRYDVTLPVPSLTPGKRHFVSQVIDYIRRFWVELGFKEMKG